MIYKATKMCYVKQLLILVTDRKNGTMWAQFWDLGCNERGVEIIYLSHFYQIFTLMAIL